MGPASWKEVAFFSLKIWWAQEYMPEILVLDTDEVESRRLKIQGQTGLHSESPASK